AAPARPRGRHGNPDGQARARQQRRRRSHPGVAACDHRKVRRSSAIPSLLNGLYLTTAIEAVVRAGDMQMAAFGHQMKIDKKGAIDLVTEVDVAVERM